MNTRGSRSSLRSDTRSIRSSLRSDKRSFLSDKAKRLERIASEIENCKICKIKKSGKAVPGEGNPDADIVFLGEAPGRNEAATGRPFIGRSGKFLREQIKKAGLRDEEVFITSPVKYLPDYITPTIADIDHGRVHLDKQLEIINPKIIVLLGNVACIAILGEKIPISKVHGQVIERGSQKFFLSFHPAAGIRFQKIKKLFVEDFKRLKGIVA